MTFLCLPPPQEIPSRASSIIWHFAGNRVRTLVLRAKRSTPSSRKGPAQRSFSSSACEISGSCHGDLPLQSCSTRGTAPFEPPPDHYACALRFYFVKPPVIPDPNLLAFGWASFLEFFKAFKTSIPHSSFLVEHTPVDTSEICEAIAAQVLNLNYCHICSQPVLYTIFLHVMRSARDRSSAFLSLQWGHACSDRQPSKELRSVADKVESKHEGPAAFHQYSLASSPSEFGPGIRHIPNNYNQSMPWYKYP